MGAKKNNFMNLETHSDFVWADMDSLEQMDCKMLRYLGFARLPQISRLRWLKNLVIF